MRYAMRIIREVGTRQVTVFPPKRCRNDQEPYRKRASGLYVEVLRVFDTLEEAQAAEQMEKLAAKLSALDREVLRKLAVKEYHYLNRTLGMRSREIAAWAGINWNTLRKYIEGKINFNARAVARLHYMSSRIRKLASQLDKLLPLNESTGNTSKIKDEN
jgi:hypothetical protein